MPRAHHSNSGERECAAIATDVKHQWRIVDFSEPRRPHFIVPANDLDSGSVGPGEFFMRQFQRFTQRDVLRGLSLQVQCLKLRQRGLEDVVDIFKMFGKFASACRP